MNNIIQGTYNLSEDRLWIFAIGTLYANKSEANKDKDQHIREYMKEYMFFDKVWYIRQSRHAIETTAKIGYKSIN